MNWKNVFRVLAALSLIAGVAAGGGAGERTESSRNGTGKRMAKRRSPPRAKLKAHRTSPPGLRPPPLPAQPMKLISEFIHSTGRGGEAKNYGIHQVEAAGRERGRHKVGQSARWAYNCGDENDSRRGRRSQDRATRARLPRTRRVHSAHGGGRPKPPGPCR